MTGSRFHLGTALALMSAAIYGSVTPATRSASQAGISAIDLVFWRAILVPVLLIGVAILFRHSLMIPKGARGPVFGLALTSALTGCSFLSSIDFLPVPFAVTIFYTFPLWVILFGMLTGKQKPGLLQIGVFITAFLGLAISVGPNLAGLSLTGVVLAGSASLFCAGVFHYAAIAKGSPQSLTFWTQIVTLPLALAGTYILGNGPSNASALMIAPIAVACSIIGYLFGFFLQMMASPSITPSRAALIFLLEPVTAVLLAGALLGEGVGLVQGIGMVIILIALAVEILFGRKDHAS